jgi:DNA-directed RNA polymerase subunit RPC12/RpoP
MRVESEYQSFVVTCEYCSHTWKAIVEGTRIVWEDEHPERSEVVMPTKLECPKCSKMTS